LRSKARKRDNIFYDIYYKMRRNKDEIEINSSDKEKEQKAEKAFSRGNS